jgi:hypothetical protein
VIRLQIMYADYQKSQDVINIEKRGNELLLQLPKSLSRDVLFYSFYKRIKGGSLEINMNNFTNEEIFGKVLALRKSKQLIELPEIKSGKGAFYWTPNGKIENIKSFNLDYLIKEKYKGKVIYMHEIKSGSLGQDCWK